MKTLELVLDRFVGLELIADQGITQIYKAFHAHRFVDVLLKVVSPTSREPFSTLFEAQNRLCLEAQATQRINHPHVVRVVDSYPGPTADTFVALEYLDGRDLAKHLEQAGPLSVPHALEIAIPIAKAIDAAHRSGVIHCDIKPSNIMLVDGGPTLVDFGCAFSAILAPYRPVGKPTGTYAYMCHQYRTTAVPTERSDLFSFGVVLYEMLTGINPFADDSRTHISETFVKRVGKRTDPKQIPPLDQLAPYVPRQLAHEIHRAMARDPEQRHRSMAELLAALESFQHRLASVDTLKTADAVGGDNYATAACGVPALARAIDGLADDHRPAVNGRGTGFGRAFFTGHTQAYGARPARPRLEQAYSSSLEALFTLKSDATHALAKAKARYDAATQPWLEARSMALFAAFWAPTSSQPAIPKDLALSARTNDSTVTAGSGAFPTLSGGTMAWRSVSVRSSTRLAAPTGSDTLPFVTCPTGVGPAAYQTLCGGFSLEALRIVIDPGTAIQQAIASESETSPICTAVERALDAATSTPGVAVSIANRPAEKKTFITLSCGTMAVRSLVLRTPIRRLPLNGPDTLGVGTPAASHQCTAVKSQQVVALQQEPELSTQPTIAPESGMVAVVPAVRQERRSSSDDTLPSLARNAARGHQAGIWASTTISAPAQPDAQPRGTLLRFARGGERTALVTRQPFGLAAGPKRSLALAKCSQVSSVPRPKHPYDVTIYDGIPVAKRRPVVVGGSFTQLEQPSRQIHDHSWGAALRPLALAAAIPFVLAAGYAFQRGWRVMIDGHPASASNARPVGSANQSFNSSQSLAIGFDSNDAMRKAWQRSEPEVAPLAAPTEPFNKETAPFPTSVSDVPRKPKPTILFDPGYRIVHTSSPSAQTSGSASKQVAAPASQVVPTKRFTPAKRHSISWGR